jgi:hypothetical protein
MNVSRAVLLADAGPPYTLQIGPDTGHSGINTDRMMEFFIDNLLIRVPAAPSTF